MVRHQTLIRPPTRVFRPDETHPSECRSHAYSSEIRMLAITNRLEGLDDRCWDEVTTFSKSCNG